MEKEIGKKVQIRSITNLENREIEVLNNNYYEIVSFIINHTEYFCIWCDPEVGEPHFVKSATRVLLENNKKELVAYMNKEGLKYETISQYNFDILNYNDSNDYLNKWNIIDDLSRSLEIDFLGNHDDYTGLYSKFVYGSNLPALNTSEKKYIPDFDDEEKLQIDSITNDMIRVLEFALGIDSRKNSDSL